MNEQIESGLEGSFTYRNWKANVSGKPWQHIFEYPLFSDSQFIGEITEGLGPYQIINNLAMMSRGPALTLRIQQHLEFQTPQMQVTQDEHYHGGSESDELAALLSLCLGVRLKAGSASRLFSRNSDPMGRPIGWWGNEDPSLPITPATKRRILKDNSTSHSLEDAKIISSFPFLSITNTIALIRSARAYQEALWMSEATPELSWIMLTSAIETVAHQWRNSSDLPIEKMRTSRPNLEEILRSYVTDKGDELVSKVAEEIAPYMGSTKTFIDFILTFLPSPPSIRPPLAAQVSWEKSAMKKAMNQIYKYRSRALHGGHPFPAPMCEPPMNIGEKGEMAEIPFASAVSMKGGVWIAKDTPMLLHTFSYIVRHSILNWWKSVSSEGKKETQ